VKLQARIPRIIASTVEAGRARHRATPILDGGAGDLPNVWKIPPHTVALLGRPAVWFVLNVTTPRIPLGIGTLPGFHLIWEQDFGGHLFLAVTGGDASRVSIVEAGPVNPNGTGALVPFCYPEDDFAKRGLVDFEPVVIDPPAGFSKEFFAELVRRTQREYDGDQFYLAVEMPFLRVGRDSNSYAVGVLYACGVDGRAIPKPNKAMHYEWVGYPGAEDPVHRANFGAYLGAPSVLENGALEVAYHNQDGSVRFVAIGGEPHATVRLPDGTQVQLDRLGRYHLPPDDARAHGLPSRHTDPPSQIATRRRFPPDPSPEGAQITLIVDGRSVPLAPGTEHRGTIVDRNDALALATLHTTAGIEVVLPLAELGVELRDPKRVDHLVRVGNELTVGLHRDRRPKLIAHGDSALEDTIRWHRFHAPPWRNVVVTSSVAALALAAAVAVWWRRRG
jgi:hypothetical protein